MCWAAESEPDTPHRKDLCEHVGDPLPVLLGHLLGLFLQARLLASENGVEIKDFVLHLAAAAGLALLGIRTLSVDRMRRGPLGPALRSLSGPDLDLRSQSRRLAAYAQLLLGGWVLLSLLSALWSTDPAIARGQSLIYALYLGWAVAICLIAAAAAVMLMPAPAEYN